MNEPKVIGKQSLDTNSLEPEVVTVRNEGGMTMEEIVIKVDLKKLKKLIKQAEEQADQLQKTLDEINEIRNLIS